MTDRCKSEQHRVVVEIRVLGADVKLASENGVRPGRQAAAQMMSPPSGMGEGKLLLTVQEAAKALNISRTTLYQMLGTGEIPGKVRIGRQIRVSVEALRAWISQKVGDDSEARH